MSWFDEQGINPNAFTNAQNGPGGWQGAANDLPSSAGPVGAPYQGPPAQTNAAPPAAGGGAGGDKPWLDWINATYGQSKSRGTGFSDLPQGVTLEQAIGRYNQETGANAKYIGGPSGDRVDFGQGVTDALTAGGQLWSDYGAMSGAPRAGASTGGGGGGGGTGGGGGGRPAPGSPGAGTQVALPTAPTYNAFQAPTDTPGPFAPTSNFGTPSPFGGQANVPTPDRLNAQQLQTPTGATYNNFDLPPGFVPPTRADAAADEGYQFALDQGKQLRQQDAASKGILQTGGFQKALEDYGQQAASQQYDKVYGRRLGEAQTAYQQGFQTNQANNAGNLAVNQANAQTGLAYGQANNQNALNFGQANNQNALAAQQAQYAQNAGTYGINQQAQAQQYGQQANTYAQNLGTYQQNFSNAFNVNQANNAGALGNYQAQVQAALGQGNLALGYQNSNNSYALGQGSLGLQQQGQNFNQGLALNQNSWNQNYQLANLGNPGAPNSQGYGVDQGSVYGQIGNANAAGQVGAGNAWNQGLGNISNLAGQTAAYYGNPKLQPEYGTQQGGWYGVGSY